MSMQLFGLKRERAEALDACEKILARAEADKREPTAAETQLMDEHMASVKKLNERIDPIESRSTIRQFDPVGLLTGRLVKTGETETENGTAVLSADEGGFLASKNRNDHIGWMNRVVGSLAGIPKMTASGDPSGVISEATGEGLASVAFATPVQILPFMKSYFANSPFEKAKSSVISVDHMRDINVPILSAGAVPTAYAEGAGPAADASGSSPFGLSGFTMKAHKRSRQVIASYESLQSTEVPMQGLIIDELLVALANAQTQDATTALKNALVTPSGLSGSANPPLLITDGSDVYGKLTNLRHSLVEGLEDPTNAFMLSRDTLALIRNTRASTSGVVMFDPNSDTILGRPYVVNEYFDSVCGAGFTAYGNWTKGAWLRRSPLVTRVLDQLYWLNSELGFVITSWADNHFVAELVFSEQAPSNQSLYYTVLS